MTSVNSPACLLARNQFYRNTTSPRESIKPNAVYSLSDWSMLQVLVWVTMSTQPGFPGAGGISKGRWVSVVLGSPKPCTAPSSPPPSPSAPVQRPWSSVPGPAPPVQRPRSSVPGPAPPVQRPRSSAPGPAPPSQQSGPVESHHQSTG